ncbi:helix-turn-helix transcriptional regulator [Paenibacillus spongiae]|uniref:Helix-turn-helix transcriptional regulator n=1 Tax=Paenibacillus spongiae TaxID=2909671 RepID=A0ABY5SKS8_9BACL|nr:helix-turn-helix transcriptional regulator [Paenibacillus spongiae]UVI33183.1 helix-turn-helix transcriptional regulator [Paenibacillus spongiae]
MTGSDAAMNLQDKSWKDYPVLPYIRLCYRFRAADFFQGERRLLDYLILFLEEGRYILQVDGAEYEILPGEFALIQPGVLFTTRGFGSCVVPNAHLDFFYNEERERSFVTTPGQTNLDSYADLLQPRLIDFPLVNLPVKLVPRQPGKLKDTLYRMIEAFKHNDIHSMLQVQKLATELLQLLLGDGEHSRSADFEHQQLVAKMNAFLSFNLSSPITVEMMAKHAGYSESHFNTLFNAHFGVTPHQYLLDLRLQKARELLDTQELKLDLIAEYCGFANASHFSKAFKRRYGMSPRYYRESRDFLDF